MNKLFKKYAVSLIVATMAASLVQANPSQATPIETAVKLSTPASGAIMNEEYVKTIGRMAYVWGWPIVNSHNRRAGITQAPAPGRLGGVVPVAPRGHLSMLFDYVEPNQSFVACPNQDVVYGTIFASLDEEPVVIQVPDFADRFWVYALYDARTDQYGEMGKAYGTKPGFYLLVGPKWKGEVPKGIKKYFVHLQSLVLLVLEFF